ncbi:uncharacterized protein LOC123271884 [Cotesia glomerata]|uniref:uncharacterized protein LOC123271884 n=1 Tax=Cotesia glomerata TaxID=32391 RepID=UPI001D0097A9|nr:uncharacterized protein LOC123271884 [Cotesia glomerata]
MSTALRKIYDAISLVHPIAAISLTWPMMQPKMQKWRAACRPRFPRNWREYAEILNQPQWFNYTDYKLGRLIVAAIQATDGSYVTTFSNPQMLATLNTDMLFMDATFKVIPLAPKAYQFFTILALVDDTAIPVFWALMERKTTDGYIAALTYFHQILTPHIRPAIVMTDFETALLRPIRTIFSEATHKGCFFHFCQAIIHKLKDLRLFNLIWNWRNGQILLRKFLALALLPAQVIGVTYNWLIQTLPNEIANALRPFIVYFRRQWINIISSEQLSIFGLVNRTNNYSEAYNRVLRLRLGPHPTIWDFTERLTNLLCICHVEYISLRMGNAVRRRAQNHVYEQNEKLQKLWWLFQEGFLNNVQFLAYASPLLQAFSEANNPDGLNIFGPYDQHQVFEELNLDDILIV